MNLVGGALAALAALTGLRLLTAAFVPLSPDEAYYWVWSRALAAGFLDHPPMVALWIRAGGALAGDNTLGIRLLAPLAAALGSVALADAGRRLFDLRSGLIAASLWNATLLANAGAVTMTPDTPLLLAWIVALWSLTAFAARRSSGWLLAAGVFAGLALDSKYTAALFVTGAGLWLLVTPALRPWLRRPAPWLAALLAAGLFAPVLWWNAGHGWASFAKQGGRLAALDPARAGRFLAELIGGQAGLATPIVFVLACAGIVVAARRAWITREPRWTLLACLTVPPALVFVQHALAGDRVQANWPAILYPPALLAAATLRGRAVRWRGRAVVLGGLLALLIAAQATVAPLRLPYTADPTLLRLAGWPALARDVDDARLAAGASFVIADNYAVASILARDLPRGVIVVGMEPRWISFALPAAVIDGQVGLFVRSRRRGDDIDTSRLAAIDRVGEAVRARDGNPAEAFSLWRVTGRDGATPAVALPRPF